MKITKTSRIITFVLALLLSMTFLSCGHPPANGNTTSDGATTPSVTESEETKFVPDIDIKDYQSEFYVVNGTAFTNEFHFVEGYNGDYMNDVVYERMVKVKDHVGVECFFVDAGSWTEYAGAVMKTVQAGDDEYQLVMTHTYQGITQLMTGNSLFDFRDFESINLDADYWAQNLMQELNVKGTCLFGYNDFCLSNVYTISFNKKLCTDNDMEYPYDLVRNKQWTLDKMMQMASVVSADDGNGVWGPEDTYGLTSSHWSTMISMMTACDIQVIDCDENGSWYVAYDNQIDKLTTLLEKTVAMYDANWARLATSSFTEKDTVPLSTGHTLFYMSEMSALRSLKGEDIAYGILPYPMFDTNQNDYKSLSWSGLLCVPTTIQNPEMVGDVLELLAYYSEPVKEAFYENLFGSKIAQDPDDAEMLKILWNTKISERAFVVANTTTSMDQLLYLLPILGQEKNTSVASFLKSNKNSAQKSMDRFFERLEKARN